MAGYRGSRINIYFNITEAYSLHSQYMGKDGACKFIFLHSEISYKDTKRYVMLGLPRETGAPLSGLQLLLLSVLYSFLLLSVGG